MTKKEKMHCFEIIHIYNIQFFHSNLPAGVRERKDVSTYLYNIQFFHNLPAINFGMKHNRERKDVSKLYLYNIQFSHSNLPTISFRIKEICAKIIYTTFNSFTNYLLEISEWGMTNKEKMCSDHSTTFNSLTATYPL